MGEGASFSRGDLFRLFLEKPGFPSEYYALTIQTIIDEYIELRPVRVNASEVVLRRRSFYGFIMPHLKFTFDVSAKKLLGQMEFGPYRVERIVYERDVPHFVALNGTEILVLRPNEASRGLDIFADETVEKLVASIKGRGVPL